MSKDLHDYYEEELLFIRQLSQEFAARYPATAGRLLFQQNQQSADPHVERLIEAFALLSGRIQHKLDDQFPELTDSVLSVLYPHYLAPIPSAAVVQFNLDPDRADLPDGFHLPTGSRLLSQLVDDVNCQFRTVFPVTLWPVRVKSARLSTPPFPRGLAPPPKAKAALHLQLETMGGLKFSDLSLERLRFFLSGDRQFVAGLHDLIWMNTLQVVVQPPGGGGELRTFERRLEDAVRPGGFGRDEGLLPYPPHSFMGYRLLTEYFAFPSKFQFIDVFGFDELRNAGYGDRADLIFYLSRSQQSLETGVNADSFRLGCSPIVNLFDKTIEPIPLSQTRAEYRLTPEVSSPDAYEIYSVDEVSGVDGVSREDREFEPFFAFHHSKSRAEQSAFWYASRRRSQRKRQNQREDDGGTEVHLSLVDLEFDPKREAASNLVIRTTCSNRDLPVRLQAAGDRLAFNLTIAAPLAGIKCLVMPTAPVRSHIRRGGLWRLISHLNLNHLSLTSDAHGHAALLELLRLYEFGEDGSAEAAVARQLVDGLTSLRSQPVVGWVGDQNGGGFCRGIKVTIELEEQNYLGSGMYLFATVLDHFFGLYASINSFVQLAARTTQSQIPFKTWPPRAGAEALR